LARINDISTWPGLDGVRESARLFRSIDLHPAFIDAPHAAHRVLDNALTFILRICFAHSAAMGKAMVDAINKAASLSITVTVPRGGAHGLTCTLRTNCLACFASAHWGL